MHVHFKFLIELENIRSIYNRFVIKMLIPNTLMDLVLYLVFKYFYEQIFITCILNTLYIFFGNLVQ